MKRLVLTMASLVMLLSMTFAQNETPMLPEHHGALDNQPAWGSSQTFDLAEGWNWWSTYITGQDITALEAALGTSALQIKDKSSFVSYTNGAWQGQLSGTVENNQMYSIQMNEATEVTLRGSRAAATDVAITGSIGWNWVGYPVNTPMTVAYALQNYDATSGDIFKSSGPFATFDGSVWVGTLTAEGQYVQPGIGYKMLSNNASGGFSFYYPAVPEETGRGYVASQYTNSTEWQPVMASNPTNMNMIAVVNFDGEELRSDNVEIGVFNGETCRGAIRPMYVESIDRYVVFLTMYGEDNEPFSFRLLDEMGDVYESNEAGVSYQADAVVGALRAPFELNFNTQKVASNLHLFPNPVKRGETVNMTLPCEGTLTVVNMLGSTVKSMNVVPGSSELSANMTPGVYTVKVTDAEGKVYVNKLVVK